MSCNVCGTEFTVKPSRLKQNKSGKFSCSPECLSESRRQMQLAHWGSGERRVAECATCGKEFTRKPSQLEKYESNYCSRACRAVGIVGPNLKLRQGQWLPCKMCDKPVWRTSATLQRYTYCSRQCANKDPDMRAREKPNMQGPKHFRWRGGISFLPYAPGWTPRLRESIRERDGNTCRICGFAPEPEVAGELVIHHIDWGKTNHDPSNLMTLCRGCHARLHHHGKPGAISFQTPYQSRPARS